MKPTLAILLVGLTACATDDTFSGSLNTPSPVGVLDPSLGGPFSHAVGYVGDRHGGRIRTLDLTTGRYLADDPFASFFRGNGLATGSERELAGVAAYAPDADHAYVFAIDKRFNQLLRVPHVVGRAKDGSPEEAVATVASTDFTDADSSGDSAKLESVKLDGDTAAAETWTLTSHGAWWEVVGSRSGLQPRAYADQPFLSTGGALSFVIRGAATSGDSFAIVADNGLTETDLAGTPTELMIAPDQSSLALLVREGTVDVLRLVDPATSTLGAPITLAVDSLPNRVAWSSDSKTLWVTDRATNALWSVDVASGVATAHATPWPTQDVAVLDGDTGTTAYLVAVGGQEVWVMDADADTLLDVNPSTPAVDPMFLRSPVSGLVAVREPYPFPTDNEDLDPTGRSVAVSLASGKVVWMVERTGCLVTDGLGPRTEIVSSTNSLVDYTPDFTVSVPGTAYLDVIEDGSRHVNVNPCGGLAPAESWILRFDSVSQAWTVEGTVSGKQSAIAYEDARYVSDNAQVHFAMRAGAQPSLDGWSLSFNVLDGVLDAEGDNNEDGLRELAMDLPGRPAIFWTTVAGEPRPFVVAAAEASDVVVKIDSATGLVDSLWE